MGGNLSNDITSTSNSLMDTGVHQSSEIDHQTTMKQKNVHDVINISSIKGDSINNNNKPAQQVEWASSSDGSNRKTGSKENAADCVNKNLTTTTTTTGEPGSPSSKLLPNEKPPIPKRTFATLVGPVATMGSDQTNKPSPTYVIGSETNPTTTTTNSDPFAMTKNDNNAIRSSNFSSLI